MNNLFFLSHISATLRSFKHMNMIEWSGTTFYLVQTQLSDTVDDFLFFMPKSKPNCFSYRSMPAESKPFERVKSGYSCLIDHNFSPKPCFGLKVLQKVFLRSHGISHLHGLPQYEHPKGTEHHFVLIVSNVIFCCFFGCPQNELYGWKCFPKTCWCEKQPFKAFISEKESSSIFWNFSGMSINKLSFT